MKILRADKLSDTEWLNLFQVTYRLPGGGPRAAAGDCCQPNRVRCTQLPVQRLQH